MERNTRQRDAIREAFVRSGRPLSVPETHVLASERVTRLGIATVYRNIKTLLEEGWLETVEMPGGPPRYEPSGKGHHHHFRCTVCDRVFDVSGCPGKLGSMVPNGFTLESHDVLLYGSCAACTQAA